MKIIIKIKFEEEVGIRIDKLFSDFHKIKSQNITRTAIQDSIKNGNLSKNNAVFKDVAYKTKLNDEYILNLPENNSEILKPKSIPLDIIYEDDDLAIINKQAGLTTHPGAGNFDDTLANALLDKYGDNLSNLGGDSRPGIVHRLDRDTTGLMVIAKNNKAHEKLSEQLQDRVLKRNYLGIIWGVLNPKVGQIDGYIEKSETNRNKMELVDDETAKYSLTNYKTIKTYLNDSLSLVEFKLDTGRTHQIRVHCSSKNCPIIGDQIYGGNARHLKKEYENFKDVVDNLIQPSTKKKLSFEVDLPNDMKNVIETIKK